MKQESLPRDNNPLFIIKTIRKDNVQFAGNWYTDIDLASEIPSGYVMGALRYVSIYGQTQTCAVAMNTPTAIRVNNMGAAFTNTIFINLLLIKSEYVES